MRDPYRSSLDFRHPCPSFAILATGHPAREQSLCSRPAPTMTSHGHSVCLSQHVPRVRAFPIHESWLFCGRIIQRYQPIPLSVRSKGSLQPRTLAIAHLASGMIEEKILGVIPYQQASYLQKNQIRGRFRLSFLISAVSGICSNKYAPVSSPGGRRRLTRRGASSS